MAASKIKQIKARQILDSNGRPAVEVDIITESGLLGRAGASTGTSVGINEAFLLRDNDPNVFGGLSVFKAIENIEKIIAPALIGMDVFEQEKIDRTMIELDGTRLKTNLGGNGIYAISVATARAASAVMGKPFYLAMAKQPLTHIFTPASNIVNGGALKDKTLAFQEFMIIPYDVEDMNQAVRVIVEVFLQVGEIIKKTSGQKAAMGNYSGHGAPSDDPFEVMDIICRAVSDLGYENNVCYALDCASSEFYDKQEKAYKYRGSLISRDDLIKILAELANKYPIAFIEDALEEEDFEGYKLAIKRISCAIIGDDLLCTSLDRVKKAVEIKATHGMIFKPNQAGTLTEALEAAHYVMEQDLLVIASGRAGGVADPPEKELAIALGLHISKTGAPRSGNRAEGFNVLMRTAEKHFLPISNVRNISQFSHLNSKFNGTKQRI